MSLIQVSIYLRNSKLYQHLKTKWFGLQIQINMSIPICYCNLGCPKWVWLWPKTTEKIAQTIQTEQITCNSISKLRMYNSWRPIDEKYLSNGMVVLSIHLMTRPMQNAFFQSIVVESGCTTTLQHHFHHQHINWCARDMCCQFMFTLLWKFNVWYISGYCFVQMIHVFLL